jgi:hypothetical protein
LHEGYFIFQATNFDARITYKLITDAKAQKFFRMQPPSLDIQLYKMLKNDETVPLPSSFVVSGLDFSSGTCQFSSADWITGTAVSEEGFSRNASI